MAYQLFQLPKAVPIASGTFVPGAKLSFFLTTTTTPTPVYSDSTLVTPITQPVVADAAGIFQAIYLNPTIVYKATLTDAAGSLLYTIDPVNDNTLSQSVIGALLYPRTAAEISAAVTPTYYYYPPGDLRRYGCDVTGSTDNSTHIANAILAAVASGGVGYIYHPGGTISHASQISIPNGLSIIGVSRAEAIFSFTGTPAGSPANTRSSWRYNSGAVNSSGYANVMIRHCKFTNTGAVNFGAAIELSAGGWSYFDIYDVWVTGTQSYGIILDGVEICAVHNCLIENLNATVNAQIWITNGADRSAGQTIGFSNIISIRENQISGGAGSVGLIDDGGVEHIIQGNNFNQNRFPLYLAGLLGGVVKGNSFETTLVTGNTNVNVASTSFSGNQVGPCTGLVIEGNGFYGNVSAGNLLTFASPTFTVTAITQAASGVVTVSAVSTVNPFIVGEQLTFSGVVGMTQINGISAVVSALGGVSGAWTATLTLNTSGFTAYASGGSINVYHFGCCVSENNFGSQLNRTGAIDVSYAANSWFGPNADFGNSSMQHYNGVHNDFSGNTLLPPQNGALPTLNISGPTHCDTRYPEIFYGGIAVGASTPKLSSLLLGSKTFDWPSIAANGNSNTTVTVTGAALGDFVVDCTMSVDLGTKGEMTAHVESANTVRVILKNLDTVSALDLASATLSVLVAKAA